MKTFSIIKNNKKYIVRANDSAEAIKKLTDAESNVFSNDLIKVILFTSSTDLKLSYFRGYINNTYSKLTENVYVYCRICTLSNTVSHDEMYYTIHNKYNNIGDVGTGAFYIDASGNLVSDNFRIDKYLPTLTYYAKKYFGVH